MKIQMNKKGFTLVELLMVVIIIGILVTLAVPNYFKAVERAKGATAKSGLSAIHKAEIAYQNSPQEEVYCDLATLDGSDIVDFRDPTDLNWGYAITPLAGGPGVDPTFIATATRLGGGSTSGLTITIDQDGVVTPDPTVPEWR